MIRDKVIMMPCAVPFRRPVNAAAMQLRDYHEIIKNPMDLGTVYSKCMLGEYSSLRSLVEDVELIVSNAKRYNPEGHPVHIKATELRELFFAELNQLVRTWSPSGQQKGDGWLSFADTSLNLDVSYVGPDAHVADNTNEQSAGNKTLHVESSPSRRHIEHSSAHLLSGGPEAVQQRMVGPDVWLLDKTAGLSKGSIMGKKSGGKRRRSQIESDDGTASKRRKQSWLGIEVSCAVRRMRTSFFTCSLKPTACSSPSEMAKGKAFDDYAKSFNSALDYLARTSNIANARHALLEFSQFRNLEFDTLRHAKYSTSILLYHLHNDCPSGIIPFCTFCSRQITDVRWHRVGKVAELRRCVRLPSNTKASPRKEELCSQCYSKSTSKEHYIPIQVSIHQSHA
jgi:hypothetical protein